LEPLKRDRTGNPRASAIHLASFSVVELGTLYDTNTKFGQENPCHREGCNKPVYRDPQSGIIHKFCGNTLAKEAIERGISGVGFKLHLLTPNHKKYQGIKTQFEHSFL
jgi:hypothetical protein